MGERDVDDEVVAEARAIVEARVFGLCGAAGVLLAGAAWLPLTIDGPSFLEIAAAIFEAIGLVGLPLVVMIGAPFLFGAALAVRGLIGESPALAGILAGLTAILQADLVYMSLQTWGTEDLIAPVALTGFAVVTSGAMIAHSSASRASGAGPTLRWTVRWGALLVAGAALWLRLQTLAGAPIGVGVDVVLVASTLIVWAARARRS